jgi:hypothetical protein
MGLKAVSDIVVYVSDIDQAWRFSARNGGFEGVR